MGEFAIWLIVASMSPSCYKQKLAEYTACEEFKAKNKIGEIFACAKPSEYQGVSLSLGKPKLENTTAMAPDCLTVKAVKLRADGKAKDYTLDAWNKTADAKAVLVR